MNLQNHHSSKTKLITLLRDSGIGSRRSCFNLIINNKVSVNGIITTNASQLISSDDKVCVNKKTLKQKAEFTYIKLNKPTGVLTTLHDDNDRATVFDLLPDSYRKLSLFPVGRLDMYTEGLLLITNDGHLALRLTHPRYEIEKEYYITLNKALKTQHADDLASGILIENTKTAPAKIVTLDEQNFKYSITVHEGRKRQIRVMFTFFGYSIKSLQRIRIHNIELGNLDKGNFDSLTKDEMNVLIDEKMTDPRLDIEKY